MASKSDNKNNILLLNDNNILKELIYNELLDLVSLRILTATNAMKSAEESRDNETKSSVGDKYETGRAMMQIEKQKNEIQLHKALTLKQEIEQIDLKKVYKRVGVGSLVYTNQGMYFISIGLGKIIISNQVLYCVSVGSPVGRLMNERSKGEKFEFQDKLFHIENIA